MKPALLLALLLTACGPDAAQVAADARRLDEQLSAFTIDGHPAPAKRTPDRLDAIPDTFRGRWARASDCGVTAPDVLTVARDRLTQGTAAATASYILRAGVAEVSIELDGAGSSWPATTTLTLLPSGQLRRTDPNGIQATLTRCPAGARR